MEYPVFKNKAEEIAFIKKNKSVILAEKMMTVKHADAVNFVVTSNGKETTDKAANLKDSDNLKAKLVINTTNIMDSHKDVHLDGIWTKSVKEQRGLYLLQEHKMSFDSIISDDVKAVLKSYSWPELGYGFEGKTQALVFEANISKDRHPFMFKQYANGYVKNHSVGMRYVKISLAVNSTDSDYEEEKAVWDKYINDIANKDEVIENGYFFAVHEAKILEGSAVPVGSNYATPTLEIENTKNIEPSKDTQNTEPSNADTLNNGREPQNLSFNHFI